MSIPQSIVDDIISNVVNVQRVNLDTFTNVPPTQCNAPASAAPVINVSQINEQGNAQHGVETSGRLEEKPLIRKSDPLPKEPASVTQLLSTSPSQSLTHSLSRTTSAMQNKGNLRRSTRRKQSAHNMINSESPPGPSTSSTQEQPAAPETVPDQSKITRQATTKDSVAGPSTITGQHVSTRASLPGPAIAANRNESHKIPYHQYCENDLNVKDGVVRQMKINKKMFYSIRKVVAEPEEIIKTLRPKIAYRKPYSDEKKEALLNNMIEKGVTENFGRIVVIRDEQGDLVVVDGCQRVNAIRDGLERGLIGLGDYYDKKPASFRYHTKRLPVLMLVPEDKKPLGDLELLGISVALNVGESSSLALNHEDVYRMLINFITSTLGERSKDDYILDISKLVDKTTKFNILDHLFSRRVRNDTNENPSPEKQVTAKNKKKFSLAERNRRERYSVYIRAAISFIHCPESLQLVFREKEVPCTVWTPYLFCYQPFLHIEELEKMAMLQLLAKRQIECGRKGLRAENPTESRRCVDLIIQIYETIRSASSYRSIMETATFQQLLGTRLTRHKDKTVRRNPYFQSIVFFVCKWNGTEEGQWGTVSILTEVKKDMENWPQSRKWKTLLYNPHDIDDEFYRKKIMYRRIHTYVKPPAKKRKTTDRQQGSRKLKKARIENDESEDSYSDTDVDESQNKTGEPDEQIGFVASTTEREGEERNADDETQPNSVQPVDGTQITRVDDVEPNPVSEIQPNPADVIQSSPVDDSQPTTAIPPNEENKTLQNEEGSGGAQVEPKDNVKGDERDFGEYTASFLKSFCRTFGLSELATDATKELESNATPSNQKSAAQRLVQTLQKVISNRLTGDHSSNSHEPDPTPQILGVQEQVMENDTASQAPQETAATAPQDNQSLPITNADSQEAKATEFAMTQPIQASAKRDRSIETREDGKRLKLLKRRWIMLSKQLPPATDVILPEACRGEGIWKYIFSHSDISGLVDMVRVSILRNLGAKWSENTEVNSVMLEMFMDSRKKDMQYQGFTVCKGILAGCDAEKWIIDFLSYYMKYFPGKGGQNERRKGKPVPWDWICNVADETDATLVKEGIGRYQVNPSKDVYHLFKHNNDLLRSKSKLEVFVATLINHILKPTSENQLRLPVFGSKIIVHTEKADAQKCHCDYEVSKGAVLREEEAKYFAVATGEKSAFLHVWPMGHIVLSSSDVEGLKMKSDLMEIPPFSVCLLRGDLPHAGAGAEDDLKMRGQFELSPRVHFYIDREEERLFIPEPNDLFFPPLTE